LTYAIPPPRKGDSTRGESVFKARGVNVGVITAVMDSFGFKKTGHSA